MKPVCLLLLASSAVHAAEASSLFEQKVKPALEAKCLTCHKADNKKGGFDLSTREAMLVGGDDGVGLVPGKPDDSPVYAWAIPHDGKKPEMPKKGETLTAEEAKALREWIEQGAVWPDKLVLKEKAKADKSFWSFLPLSKANPPVIKAAPAAWQGNPVDHFIFAKLAEKGLKPNAPADPRAFIRRATYDLLGLPPSPEEVEAFAAECGQGLPDKAVEALIDRLLSSPRYGERWGRHWLDVVRFGESRGYERNQIITNLWPFRDYVIRSFNDDKPFDQFIREHLAGDVIGKGRPEVEIGSAFLVAGPYDDVGNQDPVAAAQIRSDQMDEMVRATGEAFLGVTIGCARCHDHKFDPLLTKDYYALCATFAGTVHGERVVATPEAARVHEAAMKPLREQKEKLSAEESELAAALAERTKAKEAEAAKSWTRPRISRYGTEELFEPVEAKHVRLIIEAADAESDQKKFQEARLDEFEVWTDGPTSRNVALASNGGTASAAAREAKDFAEAYSPALTIDGKFGERWQAVGGELVITLAKPERIHRVLFSSDRNKSLAEDYFFSTFVGEYHIDVSMDGKAWKTVASSYDRVPATKAIKEKRLLALVHAEAESARLAELRKQIAAVDAKIAKVPALPSWWVGNHRAAPGPFNVFLGGSPERKGDEVVPASLSVFGGNKSAYHLDAGKPEGDRRVALANWITAPDNPLTPRVLANRVWHYHFGTGIVDTPSDFGYMGSRPTHPELLDWLAGQLQTHGWQLKPLHRLIMTSQAYRQSDAFNAQAAHEDGDSRLLWRFPPLRLDAEEVRDTLLQVAGKLNLTMGGPGFRLYEYLQDNVATYVPLDVHGPDTYRRAVYHHNARAARVDVMTDFDCPDPAFSEPRRASTTTPLQALTLMNHSFSLDMARAFAERLSNEAKSPEGQVRRAFFLCYSRPPSQEEAAASLKLVQEHGLRSFCRALLNSNELINLN